MKKYLILELYPFSFRVSDVWHDNLDKRLIIVRHCQFSSFDELKRWLVNNKKTGVIDGFDKIVIGFAPDFASTDFFYQRWKRSNSHQPIDEAEVERIAAALINGHLPADCLYVNNAIVDGYRVASIAGLNGGREIDFCCSRVQVDSQLWKELKKIIPLHRIWLMGVTEALAASVLFQFLTINQPFILAAAAYNSTALYECRQGRINYCGRLKWGEKNLLSTLFRCLAVDQEIARKILTTHYKKKLSLKFAKGLNDFLAPEFNELSRQLQLVLNKKKIRCLYFLPLSDYLQGRLKPKKGAAVFLNNSFIFQKIGFRLKLKGEMPAVALLAAAADAVSAKSLINRTISRRLRWMQ